MTETTKTITPTMLSILIAGIMGMIATVLMVVVDSQPIDSMVITMFIMFVSATVIGWKYRYSGYRLV